MKLALLAKAEKLLAQGKRLAAMVVYQEILQKQPNNIVACANLGKLLVLEGNHNTALPLLERSLQFFPKIEELYQVLVVCHLLANDTEKAKEVIAKAESTLNNHSFIEALKLELNKTPVPLQNALVELYKKGDLLTCEIGAYLNLEDYPECTLSMQVLASIEHGQGKTLQAFTRRKQLLQKLPKDSNVLAGMSESCLALDMLDDAYSYAKKAIACCSHNPSAIEAQQAALDAIKKKKLETQSKTKLSLKKVA